MKLNLKEILLLCSAVSQSCNTEAHVELLQRLEKLRAKRTTALHSAAGTVLALPEAKAKPKAQ